MKSRADAQNWRGADCLSRQFCRQMGEGQRQWVSTPVHLMLLLPGNFDSAVFTTDHESGLPYIMWDETPYEHLMIPEEVSSQ